MNTKNPVRNFINITSTLYNKYNFNYNVLYMQIEETQQGGEVKTTEIHNLLENNWKIIILAIHILFGHYCKMVARSTG